MFAHMLLALFRRYFHFSHQLADYEAFRLHNVDRPDWLPINKTVRPRQSALDHLPHAVRNILFAISHDLTLRRRSRPLQFWNTGRAKSAL
jgi:hypothetical protein